MVTLLTDADIGERIRRARAFARMTLRELADRVHVDHSTLSRWENGGRSIDAIPLLRIAYILDQPISYFTGDSPINENPQVKDDLRFKRSPVVLGSGYDGLPSLN